MKDEDCYFYIDYAIPEEERTMSVLCVDCRKEKMPDTGVFYQGSRNGYGPFDFQCEICKKFVHLAKKKKPSSEEKPIQ